MCMCINIAVSAKCISTFWSLKHLGVQFRLNWEKLEAQLLLDILCKFKTLTTPTH